MTSVSLQDLCRQLYLSKKRTEGAAVLLAIHGRGHRGCHGDFLPLATLHAAEVLLDADWGRHCNLFTLLATLVVPKDVVRHLLGISPSPCC